MLGEDEEVMCTQPKRLAVFTYQKVETVTSTSDACVAVLLSYFFSVT